MDDEKSPSATLDETSAAGVWHRWLVICFGAASVGCVAALFWAGSGFAHRLLSMMIHYSPFLSLIVTPLSFALISIITNKFFFPALGSGVPQTIAAFAAKDAQYPKKLLSLRIAAAKLTLTLWGQASGGSIGQEGPMVQIGASVMHWFERFVPPNTISRQELNRILIASGTAAGVAGAFNTPLAGVIFALEQLVKKVNIRMSAAIAISAIIAVTVAQCFYGDYAYFGRTSVEITSYAGWGAAMLCGLLGGTVGGIFTKGLLPAGIFFPPFVQRLRQFSAVGFATLCGFCVALLGILSDGTAYGNGANETRLLLENVESMPIFYSVYRLLTTFFSTFSGVPAGLFAPSLAIGAGMGANVSMLVPSVPPEAVILLGIAGFFAGVFQVPLTSAVLVMEMAGDYSMAMPLMMTALISASIAKSICKPSFYETMIQRWLEPKTINEETEFSNPKEAQKKRESIEEA